MNCFPRTERKCTAFPGKYRGTVIRQGLPLLVVRCKQRCDAQELSMKRSRIARALSALPSALPPPLTPGGKGLPLNQGATSCGQPGRNNRLAAQEPVQLCAERTWARGGRCFFGSHEARPR